MPITFPIHQKYGTAEGVSLADAGMYCSYGPEQVYEWDIDLTALTELEAVQNDVLIVPDNALLTRVVVQTLVPSATGANIDVGLIHVSRNLTDPEFTADPDGILAAFVGSTSMANQGQIIEFFPGSAADTESSLPASVTTGGVLIGDIIAAPTLLTASRTTATAFTAGRVLLRLHLRPAALSA